MKKRLLYGIMFFLLIVLILCVSISAAETLDWNVLDDGKIITCSDGRVYTYYPLNPNDEFKPNKAMVCENRIEIDDKIYYVKRPSENLEIIAISEYSGGTDYIYVTDMLRAELDEFANKKYSSYKLADKNAFYAVDVEEGYPGFQLDKKEINVQELHRAEMSKIYGLDSSGSVAHCIGAIYEVYGECYYVDYDSLDNSYFSADGEFSYREGTVYVDVLGFVDESKYLEHKDEMSSWGEMVDETDVELDDNTKMTRPVAIIVFALYTAIFGFMMPLAPIVIGLIRIISKKSEHPKRWISIMVPLGAWIVCSIVLLIMIF